MEEMIIALLLVLVMYGTIVIDRYKRTLDELKKDMYVQKNKHRTIVKYDRNDRTSHVEDIEFEKTDNEFDYNDTEDSDEELSKMVKITVNQIADQIYKIYNTEDYECLDRRDTIINLLRYLHRWDDSGIFLDNNPNIRKFIFD